MTKPTKVADLVYGAHGHVQLLQDPPVQPAVWTEFAERKPGPVQLLITPDRALTAGEAARLLRAKIKATDNAARIAQMPGIVSVEIDVKGFIQCVLAATRWWVNLAKQTDSSSAGKAKAWVEEMIAALEVDIDLPAPIDPPFAGRISLDRPFKTCGGMSSCSTVKADAARLLFNIDCSRINWAVLDTGVDHTHPAFIDHTSKDRASRVTAAYDFVDLAKNLDLIETSEEGAPELEAFIKRASHFVEATERSAGKRPKPADTRIAALKYIRRMSERLRAGRDLDWVLLEPLVTMPKSRPAPTSNHGTRVAGVIGADWRRAVEGQDTEPPDDVPMTGMCPDIRLIDVRILGGGDDDGAHAREFDILAALQFLRFLNSRRDAKTLAIHGANLSISTPHDVAQYACGATLVCAECDRLAKSGVVVVAAAGNSGRNESATGSGVGTEGRYVPISITDPGNAAGVITVGSTHAEEPHRYGVSWFSSRGPTGDGRRKPDLVAPGERILAPAVDRGVADAVNGTSFAAPHVSGAAALLIARYPEMSGAPERVKECLIATATDLGRETAFQGAGLLDVLRALQSV